MWIWSVVWTFGYRVFTRFLRNAKVEIVSEVIAVAVEALKGWGVTRQGIDALVRAAFDSGPEGTKTELELIKPSLPLPGSNTASPRSIPGPIPDQASPGVSPDSPAAATPNSTAAPPASGAGGSNPEGRS